MKITIIGSGNVATYFALAFKGKGHKIVQVYSLNNAHAKILADGVEAEVCSSVESMNPDSDIYLLAINDDALKSFADKFRMKDKIVLHTSGFHEITILKDVSLNYGVFYPLQTLNKNIPLPPQPFPICIEASDDETLKKIKTLAQSIDGDVHIVLSYRRKVLHVAAVFANNFSNHLYGLAERILERENISFGLLRPLIKATAENIQRNTPSAVQTGPAKRGDAEVIKAHLDILKEDAELKNIYDLLSQSIRKSS